MSESIGAFRRYTNLAATMHLLQTRSITLLSPDTWDDKNDRHFMDVYRDSKTLKTLTAICFAGNTDTYHHWKVFSPKVDGVCIVLKQPELLKVFDGHPGVRQKYIDYQRIETLPHLAPAIDDLPFIKRMPYQPESEYRVLYESRDEEVASKSFDISLSCVAEIILSPWMPLPLVDSVKKTLKAIKGCRDIRMFQSTLISNQKWKQVADRAKA